MRTTGIGLSILLTAVGAVLAWAVTVETSGFDINTAGLILFVVGLVGIVVSIALGAMGQHTVVEKDREVVVDR